MSVCISLIMVQLPLTERPLGPTHICPSEYLHCLNCHLFLSIKLQPSRLVVKLPQSESGTCGSCGVRGLSRSPGSICLAGNLSTIWNKLCEGIYSFMHMLRAHNPRLLLWKDPTGSLVVLLSDCAVAGGRLQPASSERAAEDVDPAAGTSSGRDACSQSAVPRPVAPHLQPSAPMKPPPMKPRAAKVRRKVAGDREHVLARRARLDAVVCGWSWPEPELLLRPAGLRWAALVLWVHHRLPTAGLRRDNVSFGLGLVVAEDAVFDRRGSARRCCLFAARIAGHQVQQHGGCRRRQGRHHFPQSGLWTLTAGLIGIRFWAQTSPGCCICAGVWYYLILSGWAGWERSEWRIRNREWVDCDVTETPTPPNPLLINTLIRPFSPLLACFRGLMTRATCSRGRGSYFDLESIKTIRKRFLMSVCLLRGCSVWPVSNSSGVIWTDCDRGHFHSVFQGQGDMMYMFGSSPQRCSHRNKKPIMLAGFHSWQARHWQRKW